MALAEADPALSSTPILLATEQDGEPLRVGVRLVVPREGTRSLVGVVGVEFHLATPGATDRPPSDAVEVRGLLPRPGMYELAGRTDLTTVPAVADGAAYTGVPVHHLLGDAGMFTLTDGERLAGQVVVVTGADGRVAVLAASEVGPRYAHEPALLATARDGVTLGADGPLCLVVPYDRGPARRLPRVVSLELRDG